MDGNPLQSVVGDLLGRMQDLRTSIELGDGVDRHDASDLWPEISRPLLVSETPLGVFRAGETGFLAVTTSRMMLFTNLLDRGGRLRGSVLFEDITGAQVEPGKKRKRWNLVLTLRDGNSVRVDGLRDKDRETLRPWIIVGRALGIADTRRAA